MNSSLKELNKKFSSLYNFKETDSNFSLDIEKNNIEETPVCPICGNKNKFKNIHVGYSEYCSGSCALRSNNIKKY